MESPAAQAEPAADAGGFALLLPDGLSGFPGPDVNPAPAVAPAPAATPAAPSQPPMLRWAYMVGSRLPDSVRQHPEDIDVLSPDWFHLDYNGNIYGDDSPDVTAFAKAHGIKLMPIIANGEFDPDVAHAWLANGDLQTRALDSIQSVIQQYGYDGINIDFENMYNSDRVGLSAFMSNVYARVHREMGKQVTLALPSKTEETYDGIAGPFDYAALAPNFDLAIVMTYDDHYAGGDAGPVAPIDWVEKVIDYATQSIPPSKLLLGVPFYGYNWNVSWGGWARAMGYQDIVSTVFANGGAIAMDPASKTPYYTYSNVSGTHEIWFENSTSLGYKLRLAADHNLAGWGAWRIGLEDQNFWSLSLGQN